MFNRIDLVNVIDKIYASGSNVFIWSDDGKGEEEEVYIKTESNRSPDIKYNLILGLSACRTIEFHFLVLSIPPLCIAAITIYLRINIFLLSKRFFFDFSKRRKSRFIR